VNFKLTVTGNPNIYTYLDEFNNRVGFFNYVQQHDSMIITSEAEINVKDIPFPDDTLEIKGQMETLNKMSDDIRFIPFLQTEPFFTMKKFKTLLREIKDEKDSILACAQKLCKYVHDNFTYQKGITNVFSTPDEVWELKSGVCQDFTNVLIQLCRLSNIPTRYVSGYVFAKDGMLGAGATHAWAEVYIPQVGWLGLDPTNNCIVNQYHIRLAVGRNYDDCSPVKGVFKGNEKQIMKVKVHLDTTKKIEKQQLNFDEVTTPKGSHESIFNDNSYQKNLQIIQQQQ
tara:strand:- start:1130 stop:1981 length:852 start_codon:yes stop_codon:yes gene_type:complete